MKMISIIISAVILCPALMIASDIQAQDYDRVLDALNRLEQSLDKVKQDYAQRDRSGRQYADLDGMISDEDLAGDPFYTLAVSMEDAVQELQGFIKDSKTAEMNRPKNPPTVGRGKLKIGGLVHEQYYHDDATEGESTFLSKRMRLSVKGDINNYAAIKFQGEFAGTPKLLDGALILKAGDNASFWVGQSKPPFGTDFLKSASALPFINASQAKKLGTDRDIGACFDIKSQILKAWPLRLSAGLFNGAGINRSDANNDKNFIARTELGWNESIVMAANFLTGKSNEVDSLKENIEAYGGSITWNWKYETAELEYIHSKVGDAKQSGWYIWGGHTIPTGSPFLKEIQFLARYEQYDDDLNINGNRLDRITLGVNLFIDKKYTKIQFNYQLNGEEETSVNNDEFLVNLQVAF